MLRIFHTHPARTSLLRDFAYYEVRYPHPVSRNDIDFPFFWQLQAMQRAQAASVTSGTSSPDQNAALGSGAQSPMLSPSASPGHQAAQQQAAQQQQHPFAMSNPAALAYAAQQMGLAQMTQMSQMNQMGMGGMSGMAGMGGMGGMNLNPMLQMQMAGLAGMGGLSGPFANPHAMQSVMRNPSPSPMPIGGQNFMGMGGMPGF